MFKLIVIGLFHDVQTVRGHPSYPQQRQLYERTLVNALKDKVVLVVEEAPVDAQGGVDSLARILADRNGVPHCNIDIARHIKENIHYKRPTERDGEGANVDNLKNGDQYAVAWNLVREHHMIEDIREKLRQIQPGATVLVIIGCQHVNPLKRQLSSYIEIVGNTVILPPAPLG